MANEKNLRPIKTLSKEEAKKRGSSGGKKSGQVRREKKLLSGIYADMMAKKYKTESGKDIYGHEICEKVAMKVLGRGDGSSVSMLKEIREATEGSKLNVENIGPVTIKIVGVEPKEK
jgi:hypothetical protein